MESKKHVKLVRSSPVPVARALAIVRRSEQQQAMMAKSVTREEIEQFWRRKRMLEEEHLLAAQKIAARIRARALTEEDYKRFEESLMDFIKSNSTSNAAGDDEFDGDDNNKELMVGVKDWWTKSKYAYLNQPAIISMEEGANVKRPTRTYIPQIISSLCSSTAAVQATNAWSLGVF